MLINTLTAFDFLSLVEKDTELRRVASTAGGEYAGPCPFCKAGRDRFHVQPHRETGALWMCRYCTDGAWKNPVDYVMRRDSLDYQAAKTLLQSEFPSFAPVTTKQRPAESPVYLPPSVSWREMAERIITQGEAELWGSGGEIARDYLRSRGIRDETARTFRLGYSPAGYWEKNEEHSVRVSAGILIPCRARKSWWYIKSRLLPGIVYACRKCKTERMGPGPCTCGDEIPRYLAILGSATASIFNAPALIGSEIGLLVEGEFDAMIAHQELSGLGISAVTIGSASNMPDLFTWGKFLVEPKRLAAAYDNDAAGKKGMEALVKLAPKVERLELPEGKDITDYHLAGGDLRAWAIQALHLPESVADKSAISDSTFVEVASVPEDPELLAERVLRITWANDAGAYLAQIQEDILHYEKRLLQLEEQDRLLSASAFPGDVTHRQDVVDAINRTLAGLYCELGKYEQD